MHDTSQVRMINNAGQTISANIVNAPVCIGMRKGGIEDADSFFR